MWFRTRKGTTDVEATRRDDQRRDAERERLRLEAIRWRSDATKARAEREAEGVQLAAERREASRLEIERVVKACGHWWPDGSTHVSASRMRPSWGAKVIEALTEGYRAFKRGD